MANTLIPIQGPDGYVSAANTSYLDQTILIPPDEGSESLLTNMLLVPERSNLDVSEIEFDLSNLKNQIIQLTNTVRDHTDDISTIFKELSKLKETNSDIVFDDDYIRQNEEGSYYVIKSNEASVAETSKMLDNKPPDYYLDLTNAKNILPNANFNATSHGVLPASSGNDKLHPHIDVNSNADAYGFVTKNLIKTLIDDNRTPVTSKTWGGILTVLDYQKEYNDWVSEVVDNYPDVNGQRLGKVKVNSDSAGIILSNDGTISVNPDYGNTVKADNAKGKGTD
jgi:hypothetical protein